MIHGKNHIGYTLSAEGNKELFARKAEDWSLLPEKFYTASKEEIERVGLQAALAFNEYSKFSGSRRAEFLDAIAEEIENLGDELVQRAMTETGLPQGRIEGERGRTTGQLRLFAQLLREGSWVEARIETAMPDRAPVPKPDIRKMNNPLGPVAVFTASNFPLAFSTAGGDTASALAAGCPVVVKAHESHLGTNSLVADAIIKAAKRTEMPDGVFSSIQTFGYKMAQELVKHPRIKAVGFTGSKKGGMALHEVAAARPEPIPVYAEMGSVNPVLLFPDKLKTDAQGVADMYANSITLGVGQFCTNPGILIGLKGEELDDFKAKLAKALHAVPEGVMLNQGIASNFGLRKDEMKDNGVFEITSGTIDRSLASATLATVSLQEFHKNPKLHEEVFGPYSIIVECENMSEMMIAILKLKGQLTVNIMATDLDMENEKSLINMMAEVAGRIVMNGAPTGVEVCYAMQHGGSFPASTDGKYTSVGQDAIKRFVKPVAY
ncbi:MAG: aldehyde dehydrogenase (NADP(+)), partial [Schleiferiaceae bacterium]|nr:aldehyde dehydrogenase (NADP(+)) [Schleiferiaceae bacterium]